MRFGLPRHWAGERCMNLTEAGQHGSSSARAKGDSVALCAVGVSAAYDRLRVLTNVDFSLGSGQLIAIVGPNGAGKSTLFKLLTGIMRPLTGTISVFGESVHRARLGNRIAYVPQEADIDWDFPIVVHDVVLSGRFGRIREEGGFRKYLPPHFAGKSHQNAAERALESVNMAEYARRSIGALSGGQKKRVFLARAIAQDADLLLLDEPLAGVDRSTETVFFDVLVRLKEAGKTILMITHDFPTVERFADTVMLLSRSVIELGPPSSVMNDDNLERTYHGMIRRAI